MADKELLELAAKAAGLEGHRYCEAWKVMAGYDPVEGCFHGDSWNPLKDDGDALRLAVKLEIEVRNFNGESHASKQGKFWCTEKWFPNGDALAATRRVITRAATKIVSPTK